MERAYPTGADGMPIHPDELHLHRSRLRRTKANQSLHHHHYPAFEADRTLITATVRDLEMEQTYMQNDQHNVGRFALHALYGPPEKASLFQYMERLDRARQTDEHMRRRVKNIGWVTLQISDVHWKQILMEYERLK